MATKSKYGGGRRHKHDEQYRRDAVELWRASGKTAKQIAEQLGIKGFYDIHRHDHAAQDIRSADTGGSGVGGAG